MFSFGPVPSCPFRRLHVSQAFVNFREASAAPASTDPFICCQHEILLILLWATLRRGEAQILRRWSPLLFCSATYFKATGLRSVLNNRSSRKPAPSCVSSRNALWVSIEILNFSKTITMSLCRACNFLFFKHPANQANHRLSSPRWSPVLGPLTDLPELGILDPIEIILTFSCSVGLFRMLLKRPEP